MCLIVFFHMLGADKQRSKGQPNQGNNFILYLLGAAFVGSHVGMSEKYICQHVCFMHVCCCKICTEPVTWSIVNSTSHLRNIKCVSLQSKYTDKSVYFKVCPMPLKCWFLNVLYLFKSVCDHSCMQPKWSKRVCGANYPAIIINSKALKTWIDIRFSDSDFGHFLKCYAIIYFLGRGKAL